MVVVCLVLSVGIVIVATSTGTQALITSGAVAVFLLGCAGTVISTRSSSLRGAVADGLLMPWFGLVFALTYGLTSLIWLDPSFVGKQVSGVASIPPALLVAAVGFGCVVLGYVIAARPAGRLPGALRVWLLGKGERAPTVGAAWCLYLVGMLARGYQISQGNLGYLADVRASLESASPLTQSISFFAGFALYGVAICAWGTSRHQTTAWRVSFIAMLAIQFGFGVLAGMKEQLVMAVVAAVLGYSFARGLMPPVRVALALALTLLIAVPVITAYRDAVVRDGGARLSPREVLSNVGGTAATARENSVGGEDAFDAFLRREARISDVAVIVHKTPNPIPYRPISEIVASPVLGVVPRVVWPSKPIRATGLEFSRQYYNLPTGVYSANAVTPYGDLYRHGGYGPLVIGAIAIGLLLGLLDGAARAGTRDPRWLFITIGTFVTVIKQESDFVTIVAALPGILIFAAIASRLVELSSQAQKAGGYRASGGSTERNRRRPSPSVSHS